MNRDSMTSTSEVCPICKGEEWVYFTEGGYTSAKRCSCYYARMKKDILKRCGFPERMLPRMTLDAFVVNTKEQARMKELADNYLHNNDSDKWFGLFGKSGTGKTHICMAICQAIVEKTGCSFKYAAYRSVIQQLRSNIFNEHRYTELLTELTEVDLLYIDDLLKFAKDQKGSVLQDELRILYDIINERYLRGKRTLFSSEYSLKDICLIDEAIGSRIRECIGEYGLKTEGANFRLKPQEDSNASNHKN